MADLPTRTELFQVGRRSLVNAPGTRRLNPGVVDIPGSSLNLLFGANSLMGEEVVARSAKQLRGLFIDTARGAQLDRVAYDRFGITRKPENPASATLTLTRPVPGVATPGTYTAGSRVQTVEGLQFATDTDAVFANFTTSVTVTATALETGINSNVAANALVQFADQPFDSNLVVTNPAAAAGGNAGERDVEFRARIRDFFPSIRRGTLAALEFGARTVPGVATAKAYELVSNSLPAGYTQLIISDTQGNASDTMVTQVSDALLEYRALGVPVVVLAGTPVAQSVTWAVSYETNVNTTAAQEELRQVTAAVPQFYRGGQVLYRSELLSAAKTVPGVIVGENSLVVPAGDVVPANDELIRIDTADVSFV